MLVLRSIPRTFNSLSFLFINRIALFSYRLTWYDRKIVIFSRLMVLLPPRLPSNLIASKKLHLQTRLGAIYKICSYRISNILKTLTVNRTDKSPKSRKNFFIKLKVLNSWKIRISIDEFLNTMSEPKIVMFTFVAEPRWLALNCAW